MQQDSILRIVVPDSDLAFEAYKEKRVDFFEILSPKNYNFRNEEYYLEIMLATFIAGNDIYNLETDWDLGVEIKNAFSRMHKELFLDEIIKLIGSSKAKYNSI